MKIELKNLDANLDMQAGTQNTRTGQDTGMLTVAPGQTAIIELTDEDHLFAAPIGLSRPESGQSQPVAPTLKEPEERRHEAPDAPTLPDATDEDIRGALEALEIIGAEKTARGAFEIAAVNAELNARGFADITAKQRDALT